MKYTRFSISFSHRTSLAAIPATRRLLYTGILALMSAVALRYVPSGLREAVTAFLGADGRAVLEHALTGFGLPALLSMMLLPETFGMRPVAPVPRPGLRAWVIPALVRLMRYLVPIVCAVYIALSLDYEFAQAFVSVNGGTPRGYVQFGQIAGDITGAWITAVLGLRIAVAS